jgi:hypothetical protein
VQDLAGVARETAESARAAADTAIAIAADMSVPLDTRLLAAQLARANENLAAEALRIAARLGDPPGSRAVSTPDT